MVKRTIDAKVRKVANSYVITIPMNLIKRLNIKEGDFLELALRR